MLLVARVDLPADSELTISYLDAEELARPRAQRLERLGFDCGCTFCTDHPEGGAPRPPSVQYTATPDELSRVLVNPLYAAYDGPLQKRLDALAKKQRVRRQLAVRSAMEAVQNVYGQLRETLQKLLDAGALQAADRQIVEFNEMAATIGMRPIAAKE